MKLLKQSSTAQPLLFLMVDSSDHITGKTGLTPTVKLSKAGGAGAAPAGAVSEVDATNMPGWYRVAGNATDTATLGPLILHASASGADPADVEYEVVAFDPQDGAGLGLSRVDVAASAIQSAVQNVQNNTFVGTDIPQILELPDSGSAAIPLTVIFNDETGSPADIDASGVPTVTLKNNAGTSVASRLGSWTRASQGKYTATYTNTAGDAIDDLHWEITGTVNTKARRHVIATQLVDTTAVDYTSTDRTNAATLATNVGTLLTRIGGNLTITAGKVDVNDKTGFKLAADGLDSVATTAPTGVAANFREMMVQLWRRFFKKATLTATQEKTYADDGTTVVTTQPVSNDGTTQTQGAAT